MSSINNNSNAAVAPLSDQALENSDPQRPQSAAQAQTFAAAASDPALLQALSSMGLTPTDTGTVGKHEATNKFSLAHQFVNQPPPLPNDRVPVTPQVQQQFEAMSSDVSQAMEGAQPEGGASGTSAQAMLQGLSEISEEEAQTPEGQEKVRELVTKGVQSAVTDVSNLTNGGMMAAFMILQVRNDASGKELTSVLQDLTSQARKTSIDVQIEQNKLAAQKVKEAADLQKKMGILAPLIEAIMAIVMVVATALTAGSMTAVAAIAFGAVVGFLAGGAIGGSQKGNGFDIGSAFMGMGIGGSVAGLAAKLLATAIAKLLGGIAARAGSAAAGQAANKVASLGSKIVIHSDKGSMSVVAASVITQALGTTAKAAMQFKYDMTTADAKEHQAKAKMEKAISDMLQNQYQALSTTLQGMLETHNNAVNQALSMLKTQFGAMQKTVAQISG